MKRIEVVVGGSSIIFEGDNLKTIDYVSDNPRLDEKFRGKLVIRDGNETIAVFVQYTYWRKMDDTENDGYKPDKEAEQEIIQKKGECYTISYLKATVDSAKSLLEDGNKAEANLRFKELMNIFKKIKKGKAKII